MASMAQTIRETISKAKEYTMEKQELLGFCDNKFTTARDLRRIFEIRWYINRAFFKSEQYAYWNKTTGSLDRHRTMDPRRVRLVDNQIQPRVRKQQSKYLRLRPIGQVLPNTAELDDRDAANLGTDLIKHLHRTLKCDKLARDVVNWTTVTGNAFVVDRWDEDKPNGGDVALEVDSPFSWYIPNISFGATEIQDMPWIIRAKLRTVDWIEQTYNVRVSPESYTADHNILMLMKDLDQAASGLETTHIPSAIVKEVWVKPCPEYKKGKYFTVGSGKVLDSKGFPNYGTKETKLLEYPVTHFRDIIVPGLFWGLATMEAAIPLQKDWNRVRSSIIEWVRTMAKGKWLLPKGAGLSSTSPDNEHGEVLEFNLSAMRGHKPEQARIIPLPQAVFQALDHNKQSMMDIFSQHEVTQGQNRHDLRSASMVAMLLEQDDTTPAASYQDFEDQWASMWKHVLMLCQKYYKNTRYLKIIGRGNDIQVKAFIGSDLKENTDVFVATGTHLPENRLAKQAVVMERFQAGLYGAIDDPKVLSRVRRMLDDAIEEDIYNDTDADMELAKDENRHFRRGIDRPVNPYDNDIIHLAEHDRDIKAPEVQSLIRQGGQDGASVLQVYMTHIKMHTDRIKQQQQEQMQMAQQMGVQPGQQGGGKGGQPSRGFQQ